MREVKVDGQFLVTTMLDAREACKAELAQLYACRWHVELDIRSNSPGKGKESNWLPVSADSCNVMLRIYWPKPASFDGTWAPPLERVQP